MYGNLHRRPWLMAAQLPLPEEGEHETAGTGTGTGTTEKQVNDHGFPDDTPVSEMTPEQRTAYDAHKREQNRQRRAEWQEATGGKTPAEIKAALEKLAEIEREKMTPSDRAVAEAKEAGRKEALAEANNRAVAAIMSASLKARGKSDDEVQSLVSAVNVTSFVTNDDVDTDKVAAYVNSIAGPVKGAGGPGHGQGHRGSSTKATGVSAGAEMFAATRKKTPATSGS